MSNSGFVLLDKIAGETSFKALFPLKRVFSTKRVGHAGTLDLRASGLIIAATGRCTRLLPFIEAKDKCYSFRLHLGYETDTLEWDGEVVEQGEAKTISREALEAILPQFSGDIEQIPPKYCAVKINGVRASDLMERGRNIELKPRKIRISELKVIGEGEVTEGCSGKEFATFDLICECSKGTYIRALGRDIGRALGTYACVSQIRRYRIGNVTLDKAVRGENLTRENLLPVDAVLDFPVVRLTPEQVAVIRQGNWLPWKEKVEGVGPDGHVFAANMQGEVLSLCFYEPGRIKPKFYLGEDEK
ncbi:tRNA pseudouridine55 synthase [Fibrobacter sp. UWB15]|uniref:tRNA pseudouridine(55) synthase TruB n=1 Tax=unclassified Fibrobacter TaxID=2634177 RepID=UPI00092423E4|nr:MULTISPECIES: tRNA pseudouridine(55) synthase TruB [unclassified Fibrobacter]PWJ67253.1 tRNA pseudouridine55 synthase [Fibrobacter sp. UWB6]SHF62518.1 tRNA pseudouridine55 synthase [Fibrobacter sp. UWB8]SMG08605.1 tRNA pseudouridine55 synthase [Fibrobacter sp. UWB15]